MSFSAMVAVMLDPLAAHPKGPTIGLQRVVAIANNF
jgi:hypothetical protein